MKKLGVNIDHVATLRQARREFAPDPIAAARICESAGADSIVAHLREDRRHINDLDMQALRQIVKSRLNMEMSINREIVKIALKLKPCQATLVPERREEITTEGGLDVIKNFSAVKKSAQQLLEKGIAVSLFIAPDKNQIKKSFEAGARIIEIHTGRYANAKNNIALKKELERIKTASAFAKDLGMSVNAGHGLNYTNTQAIVAIPEIEELNIGHSIISRAVFVGLENAVREMRAIIKR